VAEPQGVPRRQRIVVPFDGHVISQGFNSDTGERVGTGLVASTVGDDPLTGGQIGDFRFRMLTSQASLEKALNISAEIEARYALFSGGAKFDFAESSALNTASTYVLASCTVQNALRFGSGFAPTDPADRLIAAGDIDGFKRAFGDRFTQGLRTGGEFYAVVRITSSSTQHQSKIAASLHGELNGFISSGGFSAALTTAQSDASSHTELEIQVHQTAGVGDQLQIPGTDAEHMPREIIQHMNRFARAAHEHAAAYEAELVTYDTLALPFPPLMELEDRRVVLEDCLVRRQRYFSAISDLEFAQLPDASLIFQDLPPQEELVRLQNDLRSVVSALMDHARKVSTGAIPPQLFVASPDPLERLPRLSRRTPTSSSFATWWAKFKRDDPSLLQDERFLIHRIMANVVPMLSVPPETAPPETIERAANTITRLSVKVPSIGPGSPQPLLGHFEPEFQRSVASLSNMIAAPLNSFGAFETGLESLAGLETFSRLERLEAGFCRNLRDINTIVSISGIEELDITAAPIDDLSPLQGVTGLEELFIAGHGIRSLEPLKNSHALRVLSISKIHRPPSLERTAPGPVGGGTVHLTNTKIRMAWGDERDDGLIEAPIVDASALAKLPRLSNPFTSADTLRLEISLFVNNRDFTDAGISFDPFAPGSALSEVTKVPLEPPSESGWLIFGSSGLATRIGRTDRFLFTPEGDDADMEMRIMALFELSTEPYRMAGGDSPMGFRVPGIGPDPMVVTALAVRGVSGLLTRIADKHGFVLARHEADLSDIEVAVASTRPDDRSASLPAAELARIFNLQAFIEPFGGRVGFSLLAATIGAMPILFISAPAA
jgi:hypothetical protein